MSCSTTVCGTGGWNGPLPGDPDNSSVLTATSEFGGINLKWTIPNINAHAVAFTKIFRSTSADVNHSVIVGTQNGSSYFDVEPASNPKVTYYYWIQHVSINGSLLEYVGPASARAKPEIDKIIQLLAGRVETSALAPSLRNRIDIITNLESGITSLNTRLESENRLITEALDAVKNDVSEATSYIQSQMELFADEKAAFATAVNTQVSLFSEDVYAAVREETKTRAEETGALFGEKTVKIDLAGNVSGYGLSAYVDPDGTSLSEFRVAANTFSVGAPAIVQSTAPTTNNYKGKVWVNTSVTPNVTYWYNGSSWQNTPVSGVSPFIVKTSPETLDGITMPAGVYINSAVISRLSASQIDTRGLSIRGMDGEIIFSAGKALDWETGVGGVGKPQTGATRNVFRGNWTTGIAYDVGDVVIDTTGNGWSALKSHIAGTTNKPPGYPAFSSNIYWTIYAIKGEDAVLGRLTNETASIPATYNGTVTLESLGAASGTFEVYIGVNQVTASDVKFSVVAAVGCVGKIDSSGNYSVTAMSADSATLTLRAVYGSTSQDCVLTLSKSRAGNHANAYWINSSSMAIVRDAAGKYVEPTVTFTATTQAGNTEPVPYIGRFIIATTDDGVNFINRYISLEDEYTVVFTLPNGIKSIKAKLYQNGLTDATEFLVALDETTVVIVEDGIEYDVKIESTNGNIFRVGQAKQTTLIARVFRNGIDVTELITPGMFCWKRVSMNPQEAPNDDTTWNAKYQSGYKQITISVDDVYAKATFHCQITQ